MSRVRYWSLRARSKGVEWDGVERYLVRMRRMKAVMQVFIESSRARFSLPEYCGGWVRLMLQWLGEWIR